MKVFDMIGGTSTGGIIAIMLGRLQMSVEDCIKKYNEINETLFNIWDPIKAKNFALTGERYSAATLEEVIKKVVKEQLQGNENAKLLEEEDPKCKVFVLATNEKAPNNRQPVFLRSYKNPNNMSVLPEIDIWQAARATSAAPTYFEPITVGTYTLIDGGLQANNPLGWLWNEVLAVYGATRETSCFLSIGTGIPANEALPKPGLTNIFDVSSALSGIATNTEIVQLLFSTLINAYAPKATEPKYWRLNVSTYIKDKDNYEDPGKLDDLKALKKFEIKTRDYIAKESQTIQNCANALKKTS
ncbi:hypothetical protein SLS56_006750 [Neofusicoccum ribis]|uniref:PNPLA domain-containing protein n=1 Tax=Neofusicoccum ribis TaxID=45134 RepID=A0ABR3SQR9_9PEZI